MFSEFCSIIFKSFGRETLFYTMEPRTATAISLGLPATSTPVSPRHHSQQIFLNKGSSTMNFLALLLVTEATIWMKFVHRDSLNEDARFPVQLGVSAPSLSRGL